MVQPLWKRVWKVFKKQVKLGLPYGPAILLPGMYPKVMKTGHGKGICIPMFIVIVFMTAKRWKPISG